MGGVWWVCVAVCVCVCAANDHTRTRPLGRNVRGGMRREESVGSGLSEVGGVGEGREGRDGSHGDKLPFRSSSESFSSSSTTNPLPAQDQEQTTLRSDTPITPSWGPSISDNVLVNSVGE